MGVDSHIRLNQPYIVSSAVGDYPHDSAGIRELQNSPVSGPLRPVTPDGRIPSGFYQGGDLRIAGVKSYERVRSTGVRPLPDAKTLRSCHYARETRLDSRLAILSHTRLTSSGGATLAKGSRTGLYGATFVPKTPSSRRCGSLRRDGDGNMGTDIGRAVH